MVGYNAQALGGAEHRLVVAHGVLTAASTPAAELHARIGATALTSAGGAAQGKQPPAAYNAIESQ